MKKLILSIFILFSINIQAEEISGNEFISKLLDLKLNSESEHLVITKFTKNHTVSFFTHENILAILESKRLNYLNKNEVVRLVTLIDKLLEKRKQFYELAQTFSTYHILHLNEMKEYDISTDKNIGEVFKMITNIDASLIESIREIQQIYEQEQ